MFNFLEDFDIFDLQFMSQTEPNLLIDSSDEDWESYYEFD